MFNMAQIETRLDDGWFLVEIIKPMSVDFRKGMLVWCKYTTDRRDFILLESNEHSQVFGYDYRPCFKIYNYDTD